MNPRNISVIGTFSRKGEIRMYLVEKAIAVEKLTNEQGFFPVSHPATIHHLIRTFQEIKAQQWEGATSPELEMLIGRQTWYKAVVQWKTLPAATVPPDNCSIPEALTQGQAENRT